MQNHCTVDVGATIRDHRVRALLLTVLMALVIIFFTPLFKYLHHRFLVAVVFATAFVSRYGVGALQFFLATVELSARIEFERVTNFPTGRLMA